MLKAQRLEPISDLAGRREDDAARVLAEARKLLVQRETQLLELENYREPSVASTSVEMLRNREAFRLKLGEAIVQQRRVVENQRRLVEQHRQRWLGTHQQTQLFGKLIEKAHAQERQIQNRRETRELDELALRNLPMGAVL